MATAFGTAAKVAGVAFDVAERPGMQGAAELASALFTGNSYVPYGEGQQSEEAKHGLSNEVQKSRELEMER